MYNSTQIMNILKSIRNPKQAVLNMVKSNNNPMLQNLVEMAEKGDYQGVEQFTRNVFKEQGRDFDKEFSQIMNYFK